MKELDDNIIPVDEAIERFENHLLSHDRVILSAKFGDGKTFSSINLRKNARMILNLLLFLSPFTL